MAHLCLLSIWCCCRCLDAVLYQANFDQPGLPVLLLACSEFVSLQIKASRCGFFPDFLSERELLYRSTSICTVQDPLDLSKLVLRDVLLNDQPRKDGDVQCSESLSMDGQAVNEWARCRRWPGSLAGLNALTSRSASMVSKPAREPSACTSEPGSPFAVPGMAALH